MSETKWTPGPWAAEKDAWWRVVSANGDVCEVIPWPEDCDRADAHLIAAAPELYEALKNLRQSMVFMMEDPFMSLGTKCVDDADAALAKARGEAS